VVCIFTYVLLRRQNEPSRACFDTRSKVPINIKPCQELLVASVVRCIRREPSSFLRTDSIEDASAEVRNI
jgi:hypothetical protein